MRGFAGREKRKLARKRVSLERETDKYYVMWFLENRNYLIRTEIRCVSNQQVLTAAHCLHDPKTFQWKDIKYELFTTIYGTFRSLWIARFRFGLLGEIRIW